MQLYHYVHCPFCVRVRLAMGYLGIDYESKVLRYDDELTPIKLTSKKMLPILEYEGKYINESLDIINLLDKKNVLQTKTIASDLLTWVENYLNDIGNDVHSLAMPYWVWTPEFDEQSRNYFISKKSTKRGPFNLLAQNRGQYETSLSIKLVSLSEKLKPFFHSNQISILDILIASHLWGLYIVPEFQMPPEINRYLQNIKKLCHFNYHEDFWK